MRRDDYLSSRSQSIIHPDQSKLEESKIEDNKQNPEIRKSRANVFSQSLQNIANASAKKDGKKEEESWGVLSNLAVRSNVFPEKA